MLSPFRGDFFKTEAIVMLLWCVSIIVIPLGFMAVIVPRSQKKSKQMREHIFIIAAAVKQYQQHAHELPVNLQQLNAFHIEIQPAGGKPLPVVDPWNRQYAYKRITTHTAALATSGPSKRIENDLAALFTKENISKSHVARSVYIFSESEGDDWVFLIEDPGT